MSFSLQCLKPVLSMSSNENNYSVLTFMCYNGGSDQYTENSIFQNILEVYLKLSSPPVAMQSLNRSLERGLATGLKGTAQLFNFIFENLEKYVCCLWTNYSLCSSSVGVFLESGDLMGFCMQLLLPAVEVNPRVVRTRVEAWCLCYQGSGASPVVLVTWSPVWT